MQQRRWHRTTSSLIGALAFTAALSVAAPPALAAPQKAVPLSVFPSDSLTVRDPAQLTGRRVALPTATECAPGGNAVRCGLVNQLNQLDGFDLDPRLAIRFSAAVDPAKAAAQVTVQEARGGWRTGVDRVVWDPATNTLYAHPAQQLAPGTTYRLKVQGGQDTKATQDTFTTLSATDGLLDIRQQIDSGQAFRDAGIARPGLQVERVVTAGPTTTVGLRRDTTAALGTPGDVTAVPAVAGLPQGSTLVFGSYLAPSWLTAEVTIPQTPTGDAGPRVLDDVRLPFVAVLPPGQAPAGGWPTAVFGHGFGGSASSVFAAATTNSTQGLATIGTTVAGHGVGPESTWVISSGGQTFEVSAYGRGFDQNADGTIGATEGSSATGEATAQTSRDALRQTAADVMTLVRSLGGTDVDGDRQGDLSGRDVTYFGQSFGGIYGTMVAGADPTVARSVLNVPGGPITEIIRLSPNFRASSAAVSLGAAGLLNGGPAGFTEQLPLRDDPPVTADVPGALAIQQYLADATWLARPGSPETFAPLVRDDRALFQIAHGDQTVPNPTSYNVLEAGDLFGRTSLYRNDLTSSAENNPHSFLTSPIGATAALPAGTNPAATVQGQQQVAAFLGRGEVIDPDGAGPVWEVPITDPEVLRRLNFAASAPVPGFVPAPAG